MEAGGRTYGSKILVKHEVLTEVAGLLDGFLLGLEPGPLLAGFCIFGRDVFHGLGGHVDNVTVVEETFETLEEMPLNNLGDAVAREGFNRELKVEYGQSEFPSESR